MPLIFVVYDEADFVEIATDSRGLFQCECGACGMSWRGITGPMGGPMPCPGCHTEASSAELLEDETEDDDEPAFDASLN